MWLQRSCGNIGGVDILKILCYNGGIACIIEANRHVNLGFFLLSVRASVLFLCVYGGETLARSDFTTGYSYYPAPRVRAERNTMKKGEHVVIEGCEYILSGSSLLENYFSPLDENGERVEGCWLVLPKNSFCGVVKEVVDRAMDIYNEHPVLIDGILAAVCLIGSMFLGYLIIELGPNAIFLALAIGYFILFVVFFGSFIWDLKNPDEEEL